MVKVSNDVQSGGTTLPGTTVGIYHPVLPVVYSTPGTPPCTTIRATVCTSADHRVSVSVTDHRASMSQTLPSEREVAVTLRNVVTFDRKVSN